MEPQRRDADKRQASFLTTLRAVAASFFGVRGRKAHESDVARLNPIHVVLVGIMLAVVFVLTLVMIVRWVVP